MAIDICLKQTFGKRGLDKIEFNKLSSNNFFCQLQDSTEQDQDIIHQSNWNTSTSLKSIYQIENVFVGRKFCLLDTPNPTHKRWDVTDPFPPQLLSIENRTTMLRFCSHG